MSKELQIVNAAFRLGPALLTIVFAGGAWTPLAAQTATAPLQATTPARKQVISTNPFGLVFGLFNAEYERTVSDSATFGVGGSVFPNDEDDYFNADVFYRYYPSGRPLEGWAFGVKAGVTSVEESIFLVSDGSPERKTFFGAGFDINWSVLLGKTDNFYVGLGFGLKRLFGDGDDIEDFLQVIPTIRIVNVGIAF